jgi:hypothetical protein
MPPRITESEIKLHLQTLIETPGRIASYTAGLDEARLKAPPAPDEWSLVGILAHLRACTEVWSFSIYAMLTVDNPQMADIHPRDWMKRLNYAKLSFATNFDAFKVERDNLVRILQGLTFEEWERAGIFTGKVNTHTVFSQVRRMALHETDHMDQLEAMFSSGR